MPKANLKIVPIDILIIVVINNYDIDIESVEYVHEIVFRNFGETLKCYPSLSWNFFNADIYFLKSYSSIILQSTLKLKKSFFIEKYRKKIRYFWTEKGLFKV